jgi:lipid II:glycine glycyltransferase (peptidoglycan interpeptide bridge formation enzyme)
MGELLTCDDPAAWDAFVSRASDASLLQSWAWGGLKSRHGWKAVTRYFWSESDRPLGAISVLRRALPGGLSVHYAPRGPILNGGLNEWPAFWQALRDRLGKEGGTVLKLDPEWSLPSEAAVLERTGGRLSRLPIQNQATMLVDINGGDAAFARLKESTRRNIRLGERNGVTVEASEATAAIDTFYTLLQETGEREHFVVRPRAYYHDLLTLFRERGQVAVYLARHEGRALSGAVMLFYGRKLIYLFGGSSTAGREVKPTYLMHWRAIEEAQRRGCTEYDMWGVPLNPNPEHAGHGYYTFKARFNGTVVRFVGLYDLPVNRATALTARLVERFVRAGQPEFV